MSQLPSLFFIRARVRNDPNPSEARYCLVSAASVQSPGNGVLWKTSIVEGAKHLVAGVALRQDGIELSSEIFWHERDTSLDASGVFYYECKMWRTKNYLILPGEGKVWEYGMTSANKVLPSRFNHVGNGRDTLKKWYFTLDDLHTIPQAVGPSQNTGQPIATTRTNIPTHIFHAFVDLAISKNEECPISMEQFTHENIACPPCGHLFTNEALRRALESNGRCPTCRAEATIQDIQSW
jgi:hypothetical protein